MLPATEIVVVDSFLFFLFKKVCIYISSHIPFRVLIFFRLYINHYTLRPAPKSIKLKRSSPDCFVNRLVREFCNMK